MFNPKLGVSVHCVWSELTDEMLEAVGESRIATVEIYRRMFRSESQAADAALLKEAFIRSGIRPMTVHAPFGGAIDMSSLEAKTREDAMASAWPAIQLANEFDAPMIVVHASSEPIEPQERGQRLEQARNALAEVAQRCREDGRRVAVELLPRTCLGNTVEELLELLSQLDQETFGVCLDTNHLMDRYNNLADDVRRLGDRLITLHLSDYDGVDEKHWMPGEGVIDWKAFMQALRDIDYQGPFNYECTPEGDTPQDRIRSLEKNFDWLTKL